MQTQQIRKMAGNPAEFQKTIDKARTGFKDKHKEYPDFDENKIDRDQFRLMLEDISVEMEMPFPGKEDAYELFDTFNSDAGKDRAYIEKEQFQIFRNRVMDMLKASLQK